MPTWFTNFSTKANYRHELTANLVGWRDRLVGGVMTEIAVVQYIIGVRRMSGSGAGDVATNVGFSISNGYSGDNAPFSYDFTNTDYIEITRGEITYPTTIYPPAPDGTRELGIAAGVQPHVPLGTVDTGLKMFVIPARDRSTVPSFTPVSFTAGSPISIAWAASSPTFRHTLMYSFGSIVDSVIADNLPASNPAYAHTPSLSLLTQIPNAPSGPYTITLVTYDGATLVGQQSFQGVLNAPSSEAPTVTAYAVTDVTPDVQTRVGRIVQNLSRLRLDSVTATAKGGATISELRLLIDGSDLRIGDERQITSAGPIPAVARARDSRGLVGSLNDTITSLSYVAPTITGATVRRSDGSGNPTESGANIAINLFGFTWSLINGTERNTAKIEVWTRPIGGTTWTARNVVTPVTAPVPVTGGLNFSESFVITGGAIFDADKSYQVRVRVSDWFKSITQDFTVATSFVTVNLSGKNVGIGKRWEQGALDVNGQIYQGGLEVIDSGDSATTTAKGIVELATAAETKAGTDATRAVTPAGLAAALALPPTVTVYGPDSATVTAAGATWQDAGASTTITPERALEVMMHFGVNCGGNGTVYGMIGVQTAGGLALEPEIDQALGTVKYGLTAFSPAPNPVTIHGTKSVIIPAGVATSFHLRRRRNLTTVAPVFNYSYMIIEPKRWV